MASSKPGGLVAGILLYSAGVFFFAVNDALGKWLIADYGAGQLMFLRTLGAVAILVPLAWSGRLDLRVGGQIPLHVLRIACSVVDTFCFYHATRALPLAEVMTFYLAAPLIIVALSAPLLGERVGRAGWFAVSFGFVGVLVALRPGVAAVSPSALIALGGSVMFAVTMMTTRKLRAAGWLTLVCYQVVGAGAFGALVSCTNWVTPSPGDLGLMFAVGIVSMLCFMAITKALALAPPSVLAPLQYASIVWAALLGWVVWGDVPTAATASGVGIIVVSGLMVLRTGRRATVV